MNPRSAALLVLAISACVGLPPPPPQGSEVDTASSGSGSTTQGGGTMDRGSTGPVADGSASAADPSSGPSTATQDGTTQGIEPGTDTATSASESTSSASTSGLMGSSSDGAMPATCTEIFGAASGYVLCTEDADSCSFNVNTGGNSCTTICSMFGETCLDALDNPSGAGSECVVQGPSFCDNDIKSTALCVCSR